MTQPDRTPSRDLWTQRLLALDSGLLSDVLDEAGLSGRALDTAIRPVAGDQKIAGPVYCVKGELRQAGRHAAPALPAEQLEAHVTPGAVLVLASGGLTHAAPIGGIVSRSLQRHGCAGVVTDAAVRDTAEIADLGFPVYAAGVSPVNAARTWQFTAVNTPIVMPTHSGGHLPVSPGDYVLADADGCVVVPGSAIQSIIEDAEQLRDIEEKIVAALEQGATRAQAFAKYPRFEHVRRVGGG